MKAYSTILFLLFLTLNKFSFAQPGSLLVSAACGPSETIGTYNYLDSINGKPRYVKNNCSDDMNSTDCSYNPGPFYISWNGTVWVWDKGYGCIWVEEMCLPINVTGSGSVTYATSACNTMLPPCSGWVAVGGFCAPTISSGCSCCILNASVLGDTIFCESGAQLVSVLSSQSGVNYYLRDDANGTVVDGPVIGTGANITLNTGFINSTKIYNVYASNITDSANCNLELSNKVTISIKYNVVFNQSQTICDGDSLIVGNNNYFVSGNYIDTLAANNGCDSIINTYLTVKPNSSSVQNITSCNNYYWNGNLYTTTGIYLDTISNAAGCDSIVTLNLIINSNPTITTSINGTLITSDELTATYQWIDCDNTNQIIPGETNQTFTATTNGNYAVIVNNGNCIDTSACVSITTVGLKQNTNNGDFVDIYPNPTKGLLNITYLNSNPKSDKLRIIDLLGKEIYSKTVTGDDQINLSNFDDGTYFLTIETKEKPIVYRIIKE